MRKTFGALGAALLVALRFGAGAQETAASASAWAEDIQVVRAILDSNGQGSVDVAKVTKQENGRVVGLDLTSAEVAKPTYVKGLALLGKLTGLRELSLARNDLADLPEAMASLTQLRKLDLGYNSLAALPGFFSNYSDMEQLDLRYNKIAEFPGVVFSMKKLWRLQMWGNTLTTLPEDIGQLSSLKELYLKDNRLQSLPRAIMRMPALTYFDFVYNKLCNLPPDLHAWMLKRDKQYKAAQRCW